MSQYNKIKNTYLPDPSGSIDIGSDGARFGNLFLANNLALGNSVVTATDVGVPKITSLTYVGNDTAADTVGGQTITITGSGFKTSPAVYIGGSIVASVSYVSATSVTFVAPAKTAGSYSLSLVNTDGATAIFPAGVQYSGVPAWSTSAGSLANVYEYDSVSTTVAATGDAPIAYTISSGSLPSGLSIGSSNGVISGTTTAIASGSTTTNFSLNASDAQNQDTSRNFSMTVNADVVTWSSPADAASYSLEPNIAMSTITLSASSAAGRSITYTANALPTGVTLSGSTITGTPTVLSTTTTLLTATASTTGKTATRTITFVVAPAMVSATGGTVTTSGNYKIHTFTSSGTLQITSVGQSSSSVDYLIVAGGGGGGIRHAGGGGAGGFRTGSTSVSVQSYSITVGGGGTRGGENSPHATNGGDSTFAGVTSLGGGGAGQFQDNFNAGMDTGGAGYVSGQLSVRGYNGGSGGGGAGWNSPNGNGGTGTPGQGNNGGNGRSGSDWAGGGGGGAGGSGATPGNNNGGNGGAAQTSNITGSTVYYAGGGGGGNGDGGQTGLGGNTATADQKGGGGDGAYRGAGYGGNNTGGGGGGQREGGGAGAGNGGSGVVIIRYQYQ